MYGLHKPHVLSQKRGRFSVVFHWLVNGIPMDFQCSVQWVFYGISSLVEWVFNGFSFFLFCHSMLQVFTGFEDLFSMDCRLVLFTCVCSMAVIALLMFVLRESQLFFNVFFNGCMQWFLHHLFHLCFAMLGQ